MKKPITIILIIIIILASVSYGLITIQYNYNKTQNKNKEFDWYKEQEISGLELSTLMNRVEDYNNTNKVETDKNGNYINNKINSINIDIKFIDNDETYNYEIIYKNGIDKFVSYYNEIQFKCTNIEYHKNGRVCYMYFEQISY